MPKNRSLTTIPRTAIPYAVIVAALLVIAIATWVTVVIRTNDPVSVACDRPDLGSPVASTQLLGETASAPVEVQVRVLNANGRSGQASAVAEQLIGYGFSEHPEGPAGNDEATPDQDLECYGQIRFGVGQLNHAAALHLSLPCMELISDNRRDDTVDIALGTGFNGIDDSAAVQSIYESLNNGEATDPALVEQVSQTIC